jgi:phage terminase large subunit-like protein
MTVLDRATAFAEGVVAGKKVAGELEKLACERHLRDLARQGTDEFPYVWDIEKANHIQDFAESLTLAEGEEVKDLTLYPFQCFIFGSWNGWVHKDTGYRRFRTSYEQVARQNGKSLGNAVPVLYYGNFAGYQYPQIYAVATKELQAKIVMKECYKFINADSELSGTKTRKGLFTIKDYKSVIENNLTNGITMALGRDTKSIDGFRPFFGSVDEYHLHPTNQMYKLLSDGTKKLKQSLISVITTAGFDLNVPCKELYDYCVRVLKEAVVDETQFVFICQLDKDDDPWDESNWPKANPLWTPETLDSIRADAVKAREMGGDELKNFLTKDLNMWVQLADDDYINIENWKACGTDMTLEDMRGKECVVGLDLSSGGDLTSLALEFPMRIDDQRKFFIHSHSFMPRRRFQEHIHTDKAPYDIWARDGLLTPTETLGGVKTDYKYIIQYLKKLRDDYNLKFMAIAYDPHNADTFLADLEEFGCDCIEITQSARSLHTPTEDFSLEVDAGNIIYNKNNALLTWSVVNAKLTWNSFGECKVDKNYRTKRIDPVDAVIDAHKVVLLNIENEFDVQASTEEYLERMGW